MPEISRFLGMVIVMVLMDHDPPHFQVYYGTPHRGRGRRGSPAAKVSIRDAKLFEGKLPRPQANYIITWTYLHQTELLAAWEQAKRGATPNKIAPLKK